MKKHSLPAILDLQCTYPLDSMIALGVADYALSREVIRKTKDG